MANKHVSLNKRRDQWRPRDNSYGNACNLDFYDNACNLDFYDNVCNLDFYDNACNLDFTIDTAKRNIA